MFFVACESSHSIEEILCLICFIFDTKTSKFHVSFVRRNKPNSLFPTNLWTQSSGNFTKVEHNWYNAVGHCIFITWQPYRYVSDCASVWRVAGCPPRTGPASVHPWQMVSASESIQSFLYSIRWRSAIRLADWKIKECVRYTRGADKWHSEKLANTGFVLQHLICYKCPRSLYLSFQNAA